MVNLATGKKFRGISLCDNVGLITAYGNDLSFADVFSGQVEALMDEGDLLVAVSGSGNSPNVLRAIESAHNVGGKVLGVVGYDGGKMMSMCDHCVWVESFDMQLCEDVHLMFGHMVMKTLCNYSIK
jgi:D-sedoheptulose 7-phosphate isomerase